jgi:hypothetical protein
MQRRRAKQKFFFDLSARLNCERKESSPCSGEDLHRNGSDTTSTGIPSGDCTGSASNIVPGLLKPRLT